MSANVIFISPELIKSRTGISEFIDDKNINPQIKVAQDTCIQPALGSTLYLRLQAGIEADNLSNNEKTLINTYITDSLVWYTVSLLPMALGYQFFSKGVLQKTAEESNTPSRADLELISNSYKSTAEFYKNRLIQYLRENYQLYQEYFITGSGIDVIFPETRAYTSPIYLGTEYSSSIMRTYGNNSVGGYPQTIEVTPAAGVAQFTVSALQDKTVLIATRSGLVKGTTNAATTNTGYLQINGTTITLPTGDVTMVGELFTFTYR